MTTQVALIDTTGHIDPTLVQDAVVALNSQATSDLPSCWPGISATVVYLSSVQNLGPNIWPVFLVAKLPPGEGGFHQDNNNQPYAKVIATPEDPTWTVDASHEIVEMLVDPYGNKMQTSTAITISGNGVQDTSGQFQYLVEAADPCEANDYAYQIQGIAVSDFITPNFYDAEVAPGVKYSFRGNIKQPRQLLPGGYISYIDIAANEWKQILWVDPSQAPQYNDLGPAGTQAATQGYRQWVHERMAKTGHAGQMDKARTVEGLRSGVREAMDSHRKTRKYMADRHAGRYHL